MEKQTANNDRLRQDLNAANEKIAEYEQREKALQLQIKQLQEKGGNSNSSSNSNNNRGSASSAINEDQRQALVDVVNTLNNLQMLLGTTSGNSYVYSTYISWIRVHCSEENIILLLLVLLILSLKNLSYCFR